MSSVSEVEMPPEVVTVMFDVVGFADCEPNWKVFRGDAGLARGLDLVGTASVVGFVILESLAFGPVGLLGEEDREED